MTLAGGKFVFEHQIVFLDILFNSVKEVLRNYFDSYLLAIKQNRTTTPEKTGCHYDETTLVPSCVVIHLV